VLPEWSEIAIPTRGVGDILVQMSGIRSYAIRCSCGDELCVAASAAGSEVRCHCGQSVSVPKLSILRRHTGDHHSRFSTLDRIRYLDAAGDLPTRRVCALTGVRTNAVMYFSIQRKVRCLPPNRPWWDIAINSLFGVIHPIPISLLVIAAQEVKPEYVLEALACVPICIAPEHWGTIDGLDQFQLQTVLRSEPLYAELLAEFPDALISRERLVSNFLVTDAVGP
jgi:hypothetical protein